MATVEEILKSSRHRKKTIFPMFIPEKKRAWDFIHNEGINGNKKGRKKEQNVNNIITIQEQNKDETGTNKKQNKNINKNKYENKKQKNSPAENIFKTSNVSEKIIPTITHGIQNKILRILISHVKNQPKKSNTVDIPINVLAKKINASKESTRVSIKRLQKKGHLIRMSGEKGRYGVTKVKIPELIIRKYFNLFNDTPVSLLLNYSNDLFNLEQCGNVNRNKIGNEALDSSSIFIKTSTNNNLYDQLPPDWKNIDIEPLSNIGFNWSHLSQIANQNKLAAKLVQDSIYAFAFDLQENNKERNIKKDPINYFMGILCAGRVYNFSSNYESPQDQALRIYRERMNKIEQGRVEAEKEAMRLAFNEWFVGLSDTEKVMLLPKAYPKPKEGEDLNKHKMISGSAWNKFENEIWPNKKKEILQEVNVIKPKEVMTPEEQK